MLSYWCFNAALAMRALAGLGVRSIVLTSGTLAPLNSFAAELGLPFPIMLENPHVVPSSQARPSAILLGCMKLLHSKPVYTTMLALLNGLTSEFCDSYEVQWCYC